ncbi:hypothetical protein MNBD_GAMMA23-1295 [hydrothermal vent metagenome]|uniref:Uncharacterized protein n=1 Tax=hydrothermal vent metagenome TaxID=652676 RepID=A0A3B1AT49_9ZZZZ
MRTLGSKLIFFVTSVAAFVRKFSLFPTAPKNTDGAKYNARMHSKVYGARPVKVHCATPYLLKHFYASDEEHNDSSYSDISNIDKK